jgi:tetratricopeptide (TPR) repeat protein
MADVILTDAQSRTEFFRQTILVNLQYWQGWLETRRADVALLDRERNGIVRAISFTLDLEGAGWSSVRELIVAFSPYMERRGHWNIWNGVLSRAIRVAEYMGDVAGVASLSTLLARLLSWQNRFQESIAYYRRAIHTSRQIGDLFGEARACTNLGYYYIEHGHWPRAEVLCWHALKTFEQIDSDHGRAHTENHLGILYTRQNLWGQARQHLERACAIWQGMEDNHGLMRALINLGLLYNEMGLPDETLPCLEEALHQARVTGEEAETGKIYVNIGIAYDLKGEPAEAEAYAWQAEAIFQRFSNLWGLAEVWGNLGLACLGQKKWSEAITHLQASLELWRSLKNKQAEIKTLMYMVEYEVATGHQSQAIELLDEAERLISQHDLEGQDRHLQSLLANHRRSLISDSTETSEARSAITSEV